MSLPIGELVPQLIEIGGTLPGKTYEIPYGAHILGRGRDADLHLEDKDVSRRHAKLEVTTEGVLVHDLGSKNGVRTHGQRIHRAVFLRHGETFSIGGLTLLVSHPASQVAKVLQSAGETTVSSTLVRTASRADSMPSLTLPVVGVVLFGAVAVFMLFM